MAVARNKARGGKAEMMGVRDTSRSCPSFAHGSTGDGRFCCWSAPIRNKSAGEWQWNVPLRLPQRPNLSPLASVAVLGQWRWLSRFAQA